MSDGTTDGVDPRRELWAAGALAGALSINGVPLAAIIGLVGFSAAITLTVTVGITYRQLATTEDLRSTVNVIG